MYADERETRAVNHEFLRNVYVWFSEKAKKKEGHAIYRTPMGRFIEGTSHTEEKKNPYREEYGDGELVGMATTLVRFVDVPKWLPHPEMIDGTPMRLPPNKTTQSHSTVGGTCSSLYVLSHLLYRQLLSLSGMAHED